MNSIFPQLLYLSFAAIVVLRIAVAFVFLYDAKHLWKMGSQNKAFAIGWLVLGLTIGAGFLTQGAVIVAGLHVAYLAQYNKDSVFSNKLLSLVTVAILAYLLVSGAGGIAIDFPY